MPAFRPALVLAGARKANSSPSPPWHNQKRYLAGALHAQSGQVFWMETERKDSALFIALLERLWQRYRGKRIGLHPVAVIFSVMAGGQLFGMVGVLIALPVAAVVLVLLRHSRDRYLASDFFIRRSPHPPGDGP